MRYLGIDYGRKKIGLAQSEGMLAEPWKVIRYEEEADALEKLVKIINLEFVEFVIVGISEGKTASETMNFGNKLKEKISIPVIYQDESLTTQTAQELSIWANIKRKKRKNMEDAYSAALILQNYISNKQ